MAKYTVNYSCGHTATIQLYGKETERQRKIKYLETDGLCPDCYRQWQDAANAQGCAEVEMFYGEYKSKYSDCKTKDGSYNKETKTIIVYVPNDDKAKAIDALLENIGVKRGDEHYDRARRSAEASVEHHYTEEEIEKLRAHEVGKKQIEIVLAYQSAKANK